MAHILVADDDQDIRELATTYLIRHGHEVTRVADGQECLDVIEPSRPDLVLLDWMMPRLTGIEVCAHLRGMQQFCMTPIVMLTARSLGVDLQRAFAAGATDYVLKPFRPRDLVARIETVLLRAALPSNGVYQQQAPAWRTA